MGKTIHRAEYLLLLTLVREIRIAAGVTQEELSRKLGRPQSFVSDVERGTRRLDVLELRDICGHLAQPFVDFVAEYERRLDEGNGTQQLG